MKRSNIIWWALLVVSLALACYTALDARELQAECSAEGGVLVEGLGEWVCVNEHPLPRH